VFFVKGEAVNGRCYVFFDMDDTLIEWTVSWREAFLHVAGEFGVETTRDKAKQALDEAFDTVYSDLLREYSRSGDELGFWLAFDGRILELMGLRQNLREAAERVVDLLKRPEAIRLYAEVPEVLGALSEMGLSLGIVTGRPKAEPDLQVLGVRQFFHPLIDGFAAGGAKTERRMFEIAAQAAAEAGLPAWHVGDLYDEDVVGARSAGIRPVLVDRRGEHLTPDCPRVTDLRDLPAIISESGLEMES